MLNLSTAAVQTFTSFSNLDRAANRLAQAKIGVARATDLLNNKEIRLEELQSRGLGNSRKAVVLTNELATAKADLAVKTDKARIEEGALFDIQLLFVTNIANVMISSLTTIKTLKELNALATIKQRLAETSLVAMIKTKIMAQRVEIMTMQGVITVNRGATISVKGLNLSVKGLLITLGPIALVMGGIAAAMHIWENNTWGLKDSIQNLLPFLKEENSELDLAAQHLEDGRTNLEGYNGALGEFNNKLNAISTPHRTYLTMMAEAAEKLANNRDLAKQYNDQLLKIRTGGGQGFSSPSGGGGQPGTGGGFRQTVSSTGTGGGNLLPSAFGDSTTTSIPTVQPQQALASTVTRRSKKISISKITGYKGPLPPSLTLSLPTPIKQTRRSKKISGKPESTFTGSGVLADYESFDISVHPFGTDRQRNAWNLLPLSERITLSAELINTYDNAGNSQMAAAAEKLWTGLSSLPEESKILDPAAAWKEVETKNALMEATNASKRYFPTGTSESLKFGKDVGDGSGLAFYLQGINKHLTHVLNAKITPRFDPNSGREIFFAGTGGNDIAKWIKQGGGFGRNKFGGGNPILDLLSARQTQELRDSGGFQKTRTNLPQHSMIQFLNQERNVSQGAGFSQAEIRGGISATALYQNAIVSTPKHILRAIRNQDAFANGIGRYLENLTSLITGKKQKMSYRNKFRHRDQSFLDVSASTIDQALEFGFRANEEFVSLLDQSLVDVEPGATGAVGRARENVKTSVAISEQFLKMQFDMLRGVGIESTSIAAIAGEIGFEGQLPAGFVNNIHLLSQMNKTDFNNYDIIHESKNKLNMTNQEVFAIRFDTKRGDAELLDRIRFQDRLEAMSSGTSAF